MELTVEVWGGCAFAGRGCFVVLQLRNRNRAEDIGFLAPLHPQWRATSPEVIRREEAEEIGAVSIMLSPTVLGPGETYRQGVFLSPDLRFPRTGTYTVECRVPVSIVSGPEGTLLYELTPLGAPVAWLTRTVEIVVRELPREQRARSVAAFRESLRSEDPHDVLEALEDTFSMAATEPDLIPDVARLCDSDVVDIRIAACRVLEEYDSELVRETMLQLAQDADSYLSARALQWLAARRVLLTSEACDGIVARDDSRALIGLVKYLDEVDHPSRKRLLEELSRNASPGVSARAREVLEER